MEYDYADQLDLEWQSLQHRYLTSFSFQKQPSKLLEYEEALGKIFNPTENETDQEVNYTDKELCEKCLAESLNLLTNRSTPPRPSQIQFLLMVAKFTSRDETCYINLNANNVLPGAICVAKSVTTSNETKILLLGLLESFLEHPSGINGLLNMKHWTYCYNLVLEHQLVEDQVSKTGYEFLTKLLGKSLSLDRSYCFEIIQFLAGPLLHTSRIIEAQQQRLNVNSLNLPGLQPSIRCLIEILERLLEEYNEGVLDCIASLRVDVASHTVSKITLDNSISLTLDRVALIVSFFKLSQIFDGIKAITEDPLAISGFLKMVEAQIDKGHFNLVFDLYYYGLKYFKCVAEKVPQCLLNGKKVDIEFELTILQLGPLILISEKFGNPMLIRSIESDMVRKTHLSKVLQNLSGNTINVASKLSPKLSDLPLEAHVNTLKNIIRSTHMYSKQNLGMVFEALIFTFQDTIDYVKNICDHEYLNQIGINSFVLELFKAILLFIESFNLGWPDSVKILEIIQLLFEGCLLYQWSAEVLVLAGKIMQEVIARRLSPSMSLLIDCAEDLKDFGPIIYQYCFTMEWQIRKASLDLACTIADSANKSFSSFKDLLLDISLPQLASTMALNDENQQVRASAFNCLQEMIVWEEVEEVLPRNVFIKKTLTTLVSDVEPFLKKEIVKLITIAYQQNGGLDDTLLAKVYKCLQQVALENSDSGVQLEVLEFWTKVVKKHLSLQGWVDRKFPAVTFSKRIICMTNREVRKRICKASAQLSSTGCLNVFGQMFRRTNHTEDVENFLNKMAVRFHSLYREYDVTPESMLFVQDENSSTNDSHYSSTPSSNSDNILQEIIDDTVMKLMPDDLQFVKDEDLYSLMDTKCTHKKIQSSKQMVNPPVNHLISPAEFVRLVYRKIEFLGSTKGLDEYVETSDSKAASDRYNVIDY